MGSKPIGPMLKLYLYFCSGGVVRPIISAFRAEDSGSNPGRSIIKNFVKIFNGFFVSFRSKAGVPERPKGTGLGPVDTGLPGFESLLPHFNIIFYLYVYKCRGRVGGHPPGLWIPGLGFKSRLRPHLYKLFFSMYYYFSNALSFYLYTVLNKLFN